MLHASQTKKGLLAGPELGNEREGERWTGCWGTIHIRVKITVHILPAPSDERGDISLGEQRRDLGLAVDPHRDPAGGERRGRLDDGTEPAVEVGGGSEARDPDPDAR